MPKKVKTCQTESPRSDAPRAPMIPGPDLIEKNEAVRRILTSATFAKLPVLGPLLERLVNDSLQEKVGGKGYETILAVEVFHKDSKSWTPLQNDVRQGMVNLRKQLRAYYSAEGSKDNIEISFPVRSGFPPRFGYRKLTDPVQSVQRLADDFRYTFPDMEQCGRIVVELEACVAKHPSYAAGHAVLAEALLACLMCDAISFFPLQKALLRAKQAVNTGLMLNDEIWRLHVVAGAIHCCRFD